MKNKRYSKWGGYFAIRLFCVFLALSMTEVFAIKIRNNASSAVLMRCQNSYLWEKVGMTKSKRCSRNFTPMYIYYGKKNTDQLNAMIQKGEIGSKKPLPTVCSNHVTLYDTIVLVYPRIPKTKRKPNGRNPPCKVGTRGTLYSNSLKIKDKAWLCRYGDVSISSCPNPIK